MAEMNAPLIWVDGQRAEGVSPLDRGFAYGDGLFETIGLRGGVMPLLDWHVSRLRRSARALSIPLAQSHLQQSLEPLYDALTPESQGVIKIMLTRGLGGRGYSPVGAEQSRVIVIYFADASLPAASPCVVRLCEATLGRNKLLAGHKHMSRLEQVLARSEWTDPAIAEGLMCDDTGAVIEATAHNVFVWHDNQWLTPDLTEAGVNGVMRELLLNRVIPANLSRVGRVTLETLRDAREAFICNSLKGVQPIARICDAEGGLFWESESTERGLALQKAVRDYLSKAIR
ncbi:aminodeoxychorismate lyase [Gilvimarinus xylanilyticus]|uniref:Aminodeoxychorismate lyase n=1 Tax=Gilvimarinus xylanilyticus TaxID=2944139 RepID=A0A9X2HWY2_9GAMM|nr:aminodeoxychorismate lyase [Gilvimarinus xylanilyticus]MCP8898554.1 aminodeoxychorismate lyase [Gilvimarinus xylanilyticus]